MQKNLNEAFTKKWSVFALKKFPLNVKDRNHYNYKYQVRFTLLARVEESIEQTLIYVNTGNKEKELCTWAHAKNRFWKSAQTFFGVESVEH